MNFQKLHEKALMIAKKYRGLEVELLEILEELDRTKAFYKLGYSSLFDYATNALNFSQDVSYIYIRIARKSREVPQLKEEIKRGRISISKAKKISSVLTRENQKEWIRKAKTLSCRKIEKEIAGVSPKNAIPDLLNYTHPTKEVSEHVSYKKDIARVQLQVGISEELMLNIKRAQDVLSQKLKRAVHLEETLEVMTRAYLEKQDPLERAKRQEERGKLQKGLKTPKKPKRKQVPQTLSKKTQPFYAKKIRKPLSANLKHQMMIRYQGQCGARNKIGQRCPSRRHLEIHHIKPLAQGGRDEITNLILLCSGHHKVIHRRSENQRNDSWPSEKFFN